MAASRGGSSVNSRTAEAAVTFDLTRSSVTVTTDLRFRKPFSAQQYQLLRFIVLQMCCIDGLRQTFGRDHERPLCAKTGPSSNVAFDPNRTSAVSRLGNNKPRCLRRLIGRPLPHPRGVRCDAWLGPTAQLSGPRIANSLSL
jgi:hypothetical protein